MNRQQAARSLACLAVLSAPHLAYAQCTKDTDCKGERVCEKSACVTPGPPPSTLAQAPHGAEAAAPQLGPGDGFMFELDAFQVSGAATLVTSATSLSAVPGSTSSALAAPLPLASLGYQWRGNAILLGAGVSSMQTSSTADTFLDVGLAYRRYLSPLLCGNFSPFVEGGAGFVIYLPTTATASNPPASNGFAADLAVGSEWLFSRYFGLVGKLALTYLHDNYEATAGSAVDAVGFAGDIGLSVHL